MTNLSGKKTNCVIGVIGKDSLHKEWISGNCDFDLHLIVYDESKDLFINDAEYIWECKGYKLKNVYRYLSLHPEVVEQYEYFLIPDDDIKMTSNDINSIFKLMKTYQLKIGQPALKESYYSWEHTLKDKYCMLRYTNFIEMMVPCFSKYALEKVLFTFNENETGWGTENHWPLLIHTNLKDMAIIDQISVIHSRPIQSGQTIHNQEFATYMKKYGLVSGVREYGYIPVENVSLFLCGRKEHKRFKDILIYWLQNERILTRPMQNEHWPMYVQLFFLLAQVTQSHKYIDAITEVIQYTKKQFPLKTNCMILKEEMLNSPICTTTFLQICSVNKCFFDLCKGVKLHFAEQMECYSLGLSLKHFVRMGNYVFADKNIIITDSQKDFILKVLHSKIERDYDSADVNLKIETICLLRKCGYNDSIKEKELEREIFNISCTQVEHIFCLYLFYKIKRTKYLRVKIQESLKNLPPRLMTFEDAIMLLELLSD